MHLVVNAVGVKHSGGATVLLDFLNAALREPRVSQITVFCSPNTKRKFELPPSSKLHSIEQPIAEYSIARLLWTEVFLSQRCRHINADIVFCMTGVGRTHSELPSVTLIQQSLPFSGEALRCYTFLARLKMRLLKEQMRLSCRSAHRVFVQTPTMQKWVTHQLSITPERVSVVLPSVQLDKILLNDIARESKHAPIILYVGNTSPYKNVESVAEGMRLLRSKYASNVEFHLTWPLDHPICQQTGIKCLGFLTKDQLVRAYQQATMVVMPSLVETVGLPMLEAMSLGTPVLAANRPYAHDICQDAAVFFDPLSPEDFALKAMQILSSADLRDELIARGHSLAKSRITADPYMEMVDIVISSIYDT